MFMCDDYFVASLWAFSIEDYKKSDMINST